MRNIYDSDLPQMLDPKVHRLKLLRGKVREPPIG